MVKLDLFTMLTYAEQGQVLHVRRALMQVFAFDTADIDFTIDPYVFLAVAELNHGQKLWLMSSCSMLMKRWLLETFVKSYSSLLN